MNICYKCQAQTRAGTRNAVGAWLCNKCALTNHTLHYDYYDAETDSMKTPFDGMDEKEQYQHFIDFCYQLFGGLSTDTYKRAREFNQQYSYLEMDSSLELDAADIIIELIITGAITVQLAAKAFGCPINRSIAKIIIFFIGLPSFFYSIFSNKYLWRKMRRVNFSKFCST